MPLLESVVLELLEYKVQEFRTKRDVRGGTESMWELIAHLGRERDRLGSEERRRFEDLTQSLHAFGESPRGSGVGGAELNSLVIGSESAVELDLDSANGPLPSESPEEKEENAVLQRLARRVWWDDLDSYVQRLAATWRSERDRYTARVIFGTLQNLRRNAARPTFAADTSLRGFRVIEPIPTLSDPLVSLSDLDSLSEIARELVNLIMTLGRPGSSLPDLAVPEGGALGVVRQAALAVAADPYAGRPAAIDARLPSSKQLRTALQELGKERLPEDQKAIQRRELERRLIEVSAMERNERQAFQRDAALLQDLVHVFFDRLADYLPTTVGGRASGPHLEGGVLFGVNPALRTDKVPHEANAISVRMVGPVRLSLKGHDLALSGVAGTRNLFVDGREVELNGAQVVHLGRSRLGVFREADYVHLRIHDEGRTLAVRLAEALVVLHVLSSPYRDDLLTVFKVIANMVRGEPQEFVVHALARANNVSARAPNRRQALDGLLRGAAKAAAVDLPDLVFSELVGRIVQAVTVDPSDLTGVMAYSGAVEQELQLLTGEPLTVDLAGQKITVRQYRGRTRDSKESLVAMLPGQILGSFTDYLLAPHGNGTLLFARGDQELAVLFLPQSNLHATQV